MDIVSALARAADVRCRYGLPILLPMFSPGIEPPQQCSLFL
jgi:hypothetical protein